MISAALLILVAIVPSISMARRTASPTISSICVTEARFSFCVAYCSSVRSPMNSQASLAASRASDTNFAAFCGFIQAVDRITIDVPLQVGIPNALIVDEIDTPAKDRRPFLLEREEREAGS